MEQNEDLSPAIEDLLAAAPNEASLRRQVTNLLLGGSRDVRLGWLTPTRPIAPISPEVVATNRLDQAQRSIGPLPIIGRTLPITVQEPTEEVGDRRDQGSDRTAPDRERGPDKRENDPEQAVIGMIGWFWRDAILVVTPFLGRS